LSGWWRAEPGRVVLRVKVQPKARRPGLQGVAASGDGPRLRLAVTEAPEDGRANEAVCAALAEALHVAPSRVVVAQGAAARQKTIIVTGDPAALGPALERLA
jgi:uncharacterized protein